jgi:glycosyltransferase involved in cell wall biosynthesis
MTTVPARVSLVGLVAGGKSGVGRYAASLARGLDHVASEYAGLELELLTTASGASTIAPTRLRVTVPRSADHGAFRVLADQLSVRRAQADLLHYFDLSGPLLAPRRPFTTTIHDAAIRRGFQLTFARRTYKRFLQPWAVRHARAVVAVSEFARDEAVSLFASDPDRSVVIHSGPGLEPSPPEPSPVAGQRYLLYVGNLTTSKNLPLLVRAYEKSAVPLSLVLAGKPANGFAEVESAIRSSGRSGDIRLETSLSDGQLESLYREATALVLPSLYEGFGFTPLEAMARSCPVVASDIPAVREITRDAALLVDPLDERAWSDALRRIAFDDGLRAGLCASGASVVKGYSWDKAARELCELFLRLAGGGRA